ncbi:MAG: DUF4405 domain-containing protein [Aigarchaeota archaeon]|nr:DUF4405 domain-containing protein [Aigarchaeota archaeon]MCX8193635.1 DUF4405 domain-containing protein [Nitrososphaeria archaeon]MDW7987035.1 DUF4405 domain-containing protein [Nitrososphaerota archaeon]
MKLTFRAVLFYILIIIGLTTLITGLVLYSWPRGPQSGRIEFLGLRKDDWRDLHMQISIVLAVILLVHILENRNSVKVYVKTTLGS